jgi:hypothetical protein
MAIRLARPRRPPATGDVPMRFILSALLAGLAAFSTQAQTETSVRAEIDAAKKRYEAGLAQLKERVQAEFAAREDRIRSAKNGFALLKAHAAEKELFEDGGDLPLWMPTAVFKERDRLVSDLEAAYGDAVRSLIKVREDKAAERVQAELVRFWEKRFDKIDFKAATVKDGAIHLPARTAISTLDEQTGPIEVFAVVKTAKENIRLHAYNGSTLIFNWEVNRKELRVCWPDGRPDKWESGSISNAGITPLTPGVYYRIRWLIGPTGTTVYLDDKRVFFQARPLAVDKMKGKVVIRSIDDELGVKEFRVRRLVVEQ